MSSPDKIVKAIEAYVDKDQFAGAVSLVWRGGKVVQAGAVGWRDREALDPMARDTIFRIASMSKPVAAVAPRATSAPARAPGCWKPPAS